MLSTIIEQSSDAQTKFSKEQIAKANQAHQFSGSIGDSSDIQQFTGSSPKN